MSNVHRTPIIGSCGALSDSIIDLNNYIIFDIYQSKVKRGKSMITKDMGIIILRIVYIKQKKAALSACTRSTFVCEQQCFCFLITEGNNLHGIIQRVIGGG